MTHSRKLRREQLERRRERRSAYLQYKQTTGVAPKILENTKRMSTKGNPHKPDTPIHMAWCTDWATNGRVLTIVAAKGADGIETFERVVIIRFSADNGTITIQEKRSGGKHWSMRHTDIIQAIDPDERCMLWPAAKVAATS